MKGMQGLFEFLARLNKDKIPFQLLHFRDDAITVCFATVGARLEVSFFVDHIEYSIFNGDESVLDDEQNLKAMIDEFTA